MCDAILFMVKKPPEAKYSVILEPLDVDDLVNPTVILNVLGFPIVLFFPGITVSIRCTSMPGLSFYAPPPFTYI